jgi:hypothetical protein
LRASNDQSQLWVKGGPSPAGPAREEPPQRAARNRGSAANGARVPDQDIPALGSVPYIAPSPNLYEWPAARHRRSGAPSTGVKAGVWIA